MGPKLHLSHLIITFVMLVDSKYRCLVVKNPKLKKCYHG